MLQRECFKVVNERVHPKRAFQLLPGSAPGGSEHAQTGWWMAEGKVESTKKLYWVYPGVHILGKSQMQFSR